MLKVEFGSGAHKLEGWINHDIEVDIRKPLPYEDNSVDYILAEHVLEHVYPSEGYSFLKECHRILKIDGVVRILVPAIDRLLHCWTPEYGIAVMEGHRVGNGSKQSSVEGLIFGHEHQTIYTEDLLNNMLKLVGFIVIRSNVNNSEYKELNHVDMCGDNWVKQCETIVLEGRKW